MVLMIAALVLGTGMALTQQDEGPILLPKPKPAAKPAGATLLVMCDLACNWKLDGEAKGHIQAGGSAKAKVELGEHMVVVTTEDGLDKVQQLTEVKAAGQKVVNIELAPVRDARLKAEQEEKDKAAQEAKAKSEQEARDKAAHDQQEKDQQERERAARERQEMEQKEREQAAQVEVAGLVWTDPATGLMWAKKDNGSNVIWQEAMDYCRNLQLAGHSDWRLPTIDELQGIRDENANGNGWRVKGGLLLSGWEWSSSPGNTSGEVWIFGFSEGRRDSYLIGGGYIRALCVRRPGE
jgi:hypothetical protein